MVQKQINFLELTVSLKNRKIKTDLYVKRTETHQNLYSSLCHIFMSRCKRGIPYSQRLRFNRNCSDYISFDRRCNDLEKCLKKLEVVS